MSFCDRLDARARETGSLLCVGLDPHTADLPEPTGAAALAFCRRLVQATSDVALAYKPNAAFFEALGPQGVEALHTLIAEIPDDIPVILDVKRGDIASTATAYAHAAFQQAGADAVTLNGWMGVDAIAPFARNPNQGVFVLARTSNPGAAALQELTLADGSRRVYEALVDEAQHWSEHNNLGFVVGATAPGALAAVRQRAPDAWILSPGVGAQGADMAKAMAAGCREDGLGLLVSVGRGISRADDPGAAARALVAQMKDRPHRETSPIDALEAEVAQGLLDVGCVKFGAFTLKSGLVSPLYIDLRRLASSPRLLAQVARLYARILADLRYDHLGALPYAGLPIGSAVSLCTRRSMIYPRKETKAYGTKVNIEGVYVAGDAVVLIDDLATTGLSSLEALTKLRGAGLIVRDAVVLIDRQSGGPENLAAEGVTLHAVFTLETLLGRWSESGAVTPDQVAAVQAFLEETRK
ncbi:MAG: orotidine-5'-phosphate decarboxylase [Myxococcota bacterium]